jgi:hypothetical protein
MLAERGGIAALTPSTADAQCRQRHQQSQHWLTIEIAAGPQQQ